MKYIIHTYIHAYCTHSLTVLSSTGQIIIHIIYLYDTGTTYSMYSTVCTIGFIINHKIIRVVLYYIYLYSYKISSDIVTSTVCVHVCTCARVCAYMYMRMCVCSTLCIWACDVCMCMYM